MRARNTVMKSGEFGCMVGSHVYHDQGLDSVDIW
jgi:hypothetical protein